MYAISTVAFLSVLALVSSLAVVVQADGPRTQCIEMDDVLSGETCDTFGARVGLTPSEILSINSGLINISCNGPIPVSRLCIMLSTHTCTKKVTATSTTCDGLLPQSLGKVTFVEFNDNVNADCTNLVPGKSYCVSVD